MKQASTLVHYLLRIAVGFCFIGHGFWGVYNGGKEGWLPYFHVMFDPAGIDIAHAWTLMPIVGTIDILVGLIVLVRPMRGLLIYTAFWGLFTACLRPAAGQGAFLSELLERSYNFMPSLFFLGLSLVGQDLNRVFGTLRGYTEKLQPVELTELSATWLLRVSALCAFSFFIGHGIYCLVDNKGTVIVHLMHLGLVDYMHVLGYTQLALAGLILIAPRFIPVLAVAFAVKFTTEMLYPITGGIIQGMETVERTGGYAVLAIMLVLATELARRKMIRR